MIPILVNHDPRQIVGLCDWADTKLTIRLRPEACVTVNQLLGAFGMFKVMESVIVNGQTFVTHAEVYEFSVARGEDGTHG
jgi:hypothetical protein